MLVKHEPGSPERRQSRYIHVLSRAKERYNLDLDFNDLRQIKVRCASGVGAYLGRSSNDEGDVWDIHYKNNRLRVVYSSEFDELVTLLPR